MGSNWRVSDSECRLVINTHESCFELRETLAGDAVRVYVLIRTSDADGLQYTEHDCVQ